MSEKDIAFLHSLAEQLLVFLAECRIENRERLKQFKVVYVNPEKEHQTE